jgi:hypothetical protein
MLTDLCGSLNMVLNDLINYFVPKGNYLCEKNRLEWMQTESLACFVCVFLIVPFILEIIRKDLY